MVPKNPIEKEQQKAYQWAFGLALFTILYNIAEGLISTWLGYTDESYTLFGFGLDSFIEFISGLGIAHMIWRIQKQTDTKPDQFERRALQITGFSFYSLVALLLTMSFYNMYTHHKPETSLWGVIISLISILVMWLLIIGKTRTGRILQSPAILADAECTRVCIYMSVILLISSAVYQLTNFEYMDSIGTIGLAFFSYREGKECFEKAKSDDLCACQHK